jgi:hypothetical protein
MSAHLKPAEVHSRLKHPVVDGDGHWLEYTPVFAEKMRRRSATRPRTASSPR